MSPTSYQLLHPAIYFPIKFLFQLLRTRTCVRRGGYEPNELPTAPSRDIPLQPTLWLMSSSFEKKVFQPFVSLYCDTKVTKFRENSSTFEKKSRSEEHTSEL